MDSELYKIGIEGKTFEGFTGNNLQETCHKNNILHIISKAGKIDPAEMILNSHPILLFSQNKKGNTPLHIAARLGHLDLTILFINHSKRRGDFEMNMDLLRIVNENKDNVLHEAVRNGHHSVVELLLKEDPELASLINGQNESPLFLSVDREYYNIAFHILEVVQDCSYGGRDGMNALHASIIRTRKKNDYKQVDKKTLLLLNCTLYITQFLSIGSKLFHSEEDQQARITRSELVSKLLQSCPDAVEEADIYGWTPFHYAAHVGNVEIVEQILRINKSTVYIKDKEGLSALHIAARAGEIDVVRTIIAAFPDSSELLDDKDRTALHVAAESGRKDIVKYLPGVLPFHDVINEEDKEGNTVLHLAAAQGHHEILEQLASDQRVDKLARNKQGLTVIDVIQSDMELNWYQKARTISKLEKNGSLQCLQRAVVRNAARNREIKEGPSKLKDENGKHPSNNIEQSKAENVTLYTSQYIHDVATVNLLVSTIIATVTFSAAFQVPGGYNSDGIAILRKKSEFREFLIYNTLAFGFSVISMFIHFEGVYMKQFHNFTYPITYVTLLTESSLVFMASAFMMGTRTIMEKDSWFGKLTWSVAVLSFMVPFLYWIVRTTKWFNFAKSVSHPFVPEK